MTSTATNAFLRKFYAFTSPTLLCLPLQTRAKTRFDEWLSSYAAFESTTQIWKFRTPTRTPLDHSFYGTMDGDGKKTESEVPRCDRTFVDSLPETKCWQTPWTNIERQSGISVCGADCEDGVKALRLSDAACSHFLRFYRLPTALQSFLSWPHGGSSRINVWM